MDELMFAPENGMWTARLINTDVAYVVGDTPDDQLQIMRGMAEMMGDSRVGVYNDMFVDAPAEPIENILFKQASQMTVDALGGVPGGEFTARGTASLFADIEEAGEALLGFL